MSSLQELKIKQRFYPSHRALLVLTLISLSLGLLWLLNDNLFFLLDPALFWLVVETLSDAYLAVSVFVALSLLLIYSAQRFLGADLIGYLNNNPRLQIPLAAFLGVLPGCGGAIIVVTQFVHGKLSFAALVAVLISTMGDASFLLIASQPATAALVVAITVLSGIIFGYIIEAIHGPEFLKPGPINKEEITQACRGKTTDDEKQLPLSLSYLWGILLIPGILFGILAAFQIELDMLFGAWSAYKPATWLGFSGAILCLLVWLNQPPSYSWSASHADNESDKQLFSLVANETSFVSAWVIAGFLIFELLVYFTGFDLKMLFNTLGYLTIGFAILVGFIPGCGPQIIMTTLYLQGVVPLSAQLANAISNDGDALFPALALAPKASLYATLYSAIPAFIVGYIMFGFGY